MRGSRSLKKRLLILAAAIFLLYGIVSVYDALNYRKTHPEVILEETKIFDEISELDVLLQFPSQDVQDDNVKGLIVSEGFSKSIEFDGAEYRVCGYKFATKNDANSYYRRIFGKGYVSSYRISDNKQELGTRWDKSVLYVMGKGKAADTSDFIRWLNDALSIKLTSIDENGKSRFEKHVSELYETES